MVEGQLIYNFGIGCLWHFSCEKSRKGWSKGAKLKCLTPERVGTPPARDLCTGGRPTAVLRPGFTLSLVIGPVTAVTGLAGLDR
jgi:hypothetical protein